MRKLEPPQQEEFSNVAKAELVAQPTQQDLKDDVGGYFNEIEGCASAFIEGAATIFAAKHCITQVRCALQASGMG